MFGLRGRRGLTRKGFKTFENILIGLSGRADESFLFLIFLPAQKNKK
jgi:hypothetical protein